MARGATGVRPLSSAEKQELARHVVRVGNLRRSLTPPDTGNHVPSCGEVCDGALHGVRLHRPRIVQRQTEPLPARTAAKTAECVLRLYGIIRWRRPTYDCFQAPPLLFCEPETVPPRARATERSATNRPASLSSAQSGRGMRR